MSRRQFIAGAVCPECQQMDRIVIEDNAGSTQRRCVACGYCDDTMPGAGVVPATRFTRPAATRTGDQTDGPAAVRIVERPGQKSGSGKPQH